jgi:hypothetical protein
VTTSRAEGTKSKQQGAFSIPLASPDTILANAINIMRRENRSAITYADANQRLWLQTIQNVSRYLDEGISKLGEIKNAVTLLEPPFYERDVITVRNWLAVVAGSFAVLSQEMGTVFLVAASEELMALVMATPKRCYCKGNHHHGISPPPERRTGESCPACGARLNCT